MSENHPVELFADLARLLRKHGPEAFRSLAELLRKPDFVASLIQTLEVTAQNSDKLSPSQEPRHSAATERRTILDRIERLAQSEPEKAELVRKVAEALAIPGGMPLTAIRDYAQRAGLPVPHTGSRQRVVRAILHYLLDCNISTVKHHAAALGTTMKDARHLEGWTRIILDPELRSAQGA